jgi:hypothetical protein
VTNVIQSELKDVILREHSLQDVLAKIHSRAVNFTEPCLQDLRCEILRTRVVAGDVIEIHETPNIVAALRLNPLRPSGFEGMRDDQIAKCCLADIAAALLLRHLTPAQTKIDFLRRLLAGAVNNEKYRDIFTTFHLYRAIHARLTGQFKNALQYIDDLHKITKCYPAADVEAARVHLDQGNYQQAASILTGAAHFLSDSSDDVPLSAVCHYLMASADPAECHQHLETAVQTFARSPYLPTAAHFHALCDSAEARLHRKMLTQAHRSLDDASTLCSRMPYFDRTGEQTIRAAIHLAEADDCAEGDERERDYLRHACKLAQAAHCERLPPVDELVPNPRLARYLILAYLIHGESEDNSHWARALRWLNSASELADAFPSAPLRERIEKSRATRMRHLPPLVLSPSEHSKGLPKAISLLQEKYVVAYLPVCGVVRHVAQLIGITEEEAHNTIRDIEKKAAAGNQAEHIQQWRTVYPCGYKRRP